MAAIVLADFVQCRGPAVIETHVPVVVERVGGIERGENRLFLVGRIAAVVVHHEDRGAAVEDAALLGGDAVGRLQLQRAFAHSPLRVGRDTHGHHQLLGGSQRNDRGIGVEVRFALDHKLARPAEGVVERHGDVLGRLIQARERALEDRLPVAFGDRDQVVLEVEGEVGEEGEVGGLVDRQLAGRLLNPRHAMDVVHVPIRADGKVHRHDHGVAYVREGDVLAASGADDMVVDPSAGMDVVFQDGHHENGRGERDGVHLLRLGRQRDILGAVIEDAFHRHVGRYGQALIDGSAIRIRARSRRAVRPHMVDPAVEDHRRVAPKPGAIEVAPRHRPGQHHGIAAAGVVFDDGELITEFSCHDIEPGPGIGAVASP